MSFSQQEMEEFKAEALDLLDIAEKSLLSLDLGSDFRSAFDAMFRSFHNLKGASGMMELNLLQSHMHKLEDTLMQFSQATNISREQVTFFFLGIDTARQILNGENVNFEFAAPEVAPSDSTVPIQTAATPQTVSEVLQAPPAAQAEFIAECDEIVDRISDTLQLIEAKAFKKEDLEALYRDIHSLKGSAYLFSCNTLGDIAHAMESSLESVRNGTHQPSEVLINTLFKCLKITEKELGALTTKDKVEEIEKQIPALVLELSDAAAKLEPIGLSRVETTKSEPPTGPEIPKEIESNSSIRVSVSLLDNLMTLMGEMVLVRNQVLQFSSKSEDLEFLNLSKRLNVVTSEIQGEMMKTRMQPIGNILSKFNRVVRDLSHDLKKEIALNLHGADTELDKSLLESIKDPLTHIVRNSCDHGIEQPDTRAAAGKPRIGTINIRSYHEGGQVVIEISDDGKGLHKDVLLRKAIDKGILTQGQAATMNEKEIYNLIFAPGFSTAANVTNVSGRGVGMDVVRTNVERIGGSVELNSVASRGTTIKLKIPLTLAIVPALIVKCGGETYAIPQVKLEELVRVDHSSTDSKIEYLHGAPVYRLRGNILPLVNLNEILGHSDKAPRASPASNIAVLTADQSSFGLLVDEVQDTADIVVKPINRLLKSLHVYSGATILGDGSIALILDVPGIAKVAQIGNEKSKDDMLAKRGPEKPGSESQDFLIVRLNSSTKHAIVLNFVHRLEEFKISDIEHSGSQRVIRYGKAILPLISVSESLKYGTKSRDLTNTTFPVVVVQKAGLLYGLEVDEIVDTLSTDLEVNTSLNRQPGIFGNLNTPEELIVVIDAFETIVLSHPDLDINPSGKPLALQSTNVYNNTNLVPQRVSTLPAGTSLRILVVEDTVFFRRAIANVLVADGHQVTTAIDGKDALEILEKNPDKYDLVISDIEMPRMNGFELAKAVRAHRTLSGLPLLAISSRADKSYSDQGIMSGFNIYLEKLKPKVLLEAVAALTCGERKAI